VFGKKKNTQHGPGQQRNNNTIDLNSRFLYSNYSESAQTPERDPIVISDGIVCIHSQTSPTPSFHSYIFVALHVRLRPSVPVDDLLISVFTIKLEMTVMPAAINNSLSLSHSPQIMMFTKDEGEKIDN
jgi:hypothetical protein